MFFCMKQSCVKVFVSDGTGRQPSGGSKLCLKSRIPGRWVKSSSCVHRKHRNLYILRALIRKTSQETVYDKVKRAGFDNRHQGSVLRTFPVDAADECLTGQGKGQCS